MPIKKQSLSIEIEIFTKNFTIFNIVIHGTFIGRSNKIFQIFPLKIINNQSFASSYVGKLIHHDYQFENLGISQINILHCLGDESHAKFGR